MTKEEKIEWVLKGAKLKMVYSSMRGRCNNPKDAGYKRYGGRGIKVCDRWNNSFKAFIEDVIEGYEVGLQLDRINNDGHYEPSNTRWATRRENSGNTRVSRCYEGVCLSEWARRMGIKKSFLRSRLARGWTWEEALNTPKKSVLRYKGKTVAEWAKETGITVSALAGRLRSGYSWEESLKKSFYREYRGKRPSEWAKKVKSAKRTINERLKKGQPWEKALGLNLMQSLGLEEVA